VGRNAKGVFLKFGIKYDAYKNSKRFKQKFEKFLESDAWKDEAAALAIKKIKGETRLRRFIEDGSNQPPLSPSWIERRGELAKVNPTGVSYGTAKSNLTLTGQLLESLKRIPSRFSVIIQAMGDRQPYRNKDGSTAKSTPSNSQLAKYLAERGRFFIGFDQKLKDQIKKKIKEHIRRNLLGK
jgi:hypothetical protein